MKINYRKTYEQEKRIGAITSDCGSVYMLCFDGLTQRYRYLDLDSGVILSIEYDSIQDLFQDNGDSELVSHAEIIIVE